MSDIEQTAWILLEESVVHYHGEPVGTVAARDDGIDALNYDQVFTRDFAVSAVAFLLHGDYAIVRHFLLATLELQCAERHMDCFRPGLGVMPASFKMEPNGDSERLAGDFGEHAIARVSPIDSGFWWLYLLYAYTRASGDEELARREDVQRGIRLILELCLPPRHEMLPTLLVPDGAFMIDRRMGVYGHPLDIQALFHIALRGAETLLVAPASDPVIAAVKERIAHLTYHLRTYYWLDMERLNQIYRYRVEEFGESAVNRFNIYPDTIPLWLFEWMPRNGGYFAGNLGPARMDFRLFAQGNLLTILGGLADAGQTRAIMELYEARWDDLMGEVPVKLVYPALEGRDWQLLTGSDPKNTPWSYHNGGNWPFLLWLFTAAAIRTGHENLAQQALEAVERRLHRDNWPEYYDGPRGRLVGKEARRRQTWTIAGYLAARQLLDQPERIAILGCAKESEPTACGISS
jgi:hypothetical protein